MRTLNVGLGLVVAAITVGTAGAASAAPQQVTCGGTVTGYARLTQDLHCAAGDGVTLTGDATLDLRGHRLVGTGSTIGVLTSTTGTSTIVNGTLQGWGRAVTGNLDFEGEPVVAVRGVRFVDNSFAAIDAIRSTVTVDRSSVRGGDRGVNVIFGSALTVTRSTFRDLQSAVHTGEARNVTVTRSTFTGNRTAIDCGDSICDVNRSLIADNDEAVRAFNATVTVADNEIAGNGVGYQVAAEEPVDVLLDRNTFRRNGDGVFAPVAGTRLAGNSAVRNCRWGIYAPGAVDLGGNTASGNGNDPQCVGLVCG